MKKFSLTLATIILAVAWLPILPAAAYNFGNYSSETLTTKAWGALEAGDTEGVLAYTNKCFELYAKKARELQTSLDGYPQDSKDELFKKYWALNDVATSLFIQGEAFRKADMLEEAKAAYQRVMNEFSFGQTWDEGGWFWKPAEAAKEKLAMIESGSTLDFGDYTSSFLVNQAWKALADGDVETIEAYTNKVLELYEAQAKVMQDSLTEYPWNSKEKIFEYWALNDVGTALYIKGEAYRKAGQLEQAKEAYNKLVDEFSYAQCWDPSWQGFWKPSIAAQEVMDEMGEI